jgi:flagellar biosynthesis protein FliQ
MDKYTFWGIYLIVTLLFVIGIVIYVAVTTHNLEILAFIPLIVLLWLLDAEYIAIDKEYHG